MPFCPTCRLEYLEGISRCADCDAALVDSLPVPASPEREDLEGKVVELASFATVAEAEMVQELLEGNAISTVVCGETDPLGIAGGPWRVTLLVREQSLPQAKEIYEAFFAGDTVSDESQSAGGASPTNQSEES